MTQSAIQQAATTLHAYMTFRASRERVPHELPIGYYARALASGIRSFFGVEVSGAGNLVEDTHNPQAFAMFKGQSDAVSGRRRKGAKTETPLGEWPSMWRCRCDCGDEITATTCDVREGRIRSCGCESGIVRSSVIPQEAGH